MDKKTTQETTRILRIAEWDSNYENNRTRDLKHMAWIPVSNKHDGDGYTTLVDHKNGAAHLGCWLAILQVASKCEIRGTLVRDNGRPHDATSISRLTRLPAPMIQETIDRCLCDEVGWLQVVDTEGNEAIPQEGARIPHPTDYGTEGNGTEKKEGTPSAEEASEPSDKKQKRFTAPTEDEVRAYVLERGSAVDPQTFVDFYAAKGWMIGKNKVKDWKACVRTWEKRNPKPKDEEYEY